MNKRRRFIRKRNRQIKKWIRQYQQLLKLFIEDDEPWVSYQKRRRWFLMDKLGTKTWT